MARFTAANYTNPAFTYATADSDVFADTDLQSLAQAFDVHDHTLGNGKQIPSGGIANLAITTALLAANAVTLAKMDLSTWGVLARLNALIVVPEGTVADNGAGALTLGSTLKIVNPVTGTWTRVASGTYNLAADGYLYVDIPSTGAERVTLTPTVGVWADADINMPNTDRYLLAYRIGSGAIYCRWLNSAGNLAAGIAAQYITAAMIANGTITAAQIANATITAAQIAGSTITAAQMANGSIGTSQLAASPTITTPTISGHLYGSGAAPTAAVGASAGSGAPAPIVSSASSDFRGSISFGTGTGPSAGEQVIVTYNAAVSSPGAYIMLVATNPATAALLPYISGSTTSIFKIAFQSPPAASQGNTVYAIQYHVIG